MIRRKVGEGGRSPRPDRPAEPHGQNKRNDSHVTQVELRDRSNITHTFG